MTGYNIYLKQVDDDGPKGWEMEPIFLHLSYNNLADAQHAVAVLEELYGKGAIEVDVKVAEHSLVE